MKRAGDMLSLYRRHLATCPHRDKGRAFYKCECPIHADGVVNGRRVRMSMDTVNWQRAQRRAAEIEGEVLDGKVRKRVSEAAESFIASRATEPSTRKKYVRIMKRLVEFCAGRGLANVDRISLEALDGYRASRKLLPLTWTKELQLLRTFFEFCKKRRWCEENPAKEMHMPRDAKPRPREPYTLEEMQRILDACDTFGRNPYERLRARAMILLMRKYGLRVSDVATLRRDRIGETEIRLHAVKNARDIRLPLYPDVKFALDVLPAPMGAPAGCPYYFWTGVGDRDGHVKTVVRTLQAVFRKSGVKNATAHRFRHTLATEILVEGGTIEDAANVLGDSPAIIRKHYAKWSPDYQRRTIAVLSKVHGEPFGTPVAREPEVPASLLKSGDKLVLEVGVEPT